MTDVMDPLVDHPIVDVYRSSLKLPLGGQGVRPMSVDNDVIRRAPAANTKANGIDSVEGTCDTVSDHSILDNALKSIENINLVRVSGRLVRVNGMLLE